MFSFCNKLLMVYEWDNNSKLSFNLETLTITGTGLFVSTVITFNLFLKI